MAFEKPILTIGLPLYRSGLFGKRSVLSAYLAASENPRIELLICDNNPLADRSFIHSLGSPRVRYFANPYNLGFPANFYTVYLHALGDYILFLGDDDCLSPHFPELVDHLCEAGDLGHADVVATAPTFIVSPNPQETHVPQQSFLNTMQSGSCTSRIKAYTRYTHINFIIQSMFKRDSVDFSSWWLFWALCPGYTTVLDWAVSYGVVIHHKIKQLNHGFYIYDMANWRPGGAWIPREIQAMRAFVKEGLRAQLSDQDVWVIYQTNVAAIVLGYLLSLESAYSKRGCGLCDPGRFQAIQACMQDAFITKIPNLSWAPSSSGGDSSDLFALLDLLLANLVPHLSCGQELFSFLRAAARGLISLDSSQALALMTQRFAGHHHVSLD